MVAFAAQITAHRRVHHWRPLHAVLPKGQQPATHYIATRPTKPHGCYQPLPCQPRSSPCDSISRPELRPSPFHPSYVQYHP